MIESVIPTLVPADPRVTVGRFTYGSPVFKMWTDSERIEIGAFCSIADDVKIFGGGEHHSEWVATYPVRIALGQTVVGREENPTSKGITRIGNDVWIGYGATILSGVTIGDGAIIGAQAVVTRSVPAYQIVAGNPAKIVKSRFSKVQVDALCRICWWDWPIERIRDFAAMLNGPEIDAFIEWADALASKAPDSTNVRED